MKRDDDRLRRLLLDLVEQPDAWTEHITYITMSKEEEQDAYHLRLLEDAELIKVEDERRFFMNNEMPKKDGRHYSKSRILRVTNAGQDFAAAVGDDTIWNKTKAGAQKIGGATLAIMKDLAIGFLKHEAKEKLGIDLK